MEEVEIAFVAKLKLGALWRCAKKLGSQSALARHLGVYPGVIGDWLSMANYPRCVGQRKDDLDIKLAMVGAPTFDEIWPESLRAEIDRRRQKGQTRWAQIEAIRTVPVEQIARLEAESHVMPMLTVDTTEDVEAIQAKVLDALRFLKPRESRALRLRYGLGGEPQTLDAISREIGVSKERVRQIVAKAQSRLSQVPGLAACVGLAREPD